MSLGGSRYFISFIDDYNRHTWIYLIEKKSEVFDCFRNLKNLVEREVARMIRCLRSDGRKEYFSGQFNGYLQQMEIRHEFNCRYTPEKNVIAETKNRSVVEATRAMMEEKSMHKFYGAEVVRNTIYIPNRIRENVSAHELYFGRKFNLRHLRVFDSIAYVHVPNEKRRKIDTKVEKCNKRVTSVITPIPNKLALS